MRKFTKRLASVYIASPSCGRERWAPTASNAAVDSSSFAPHWSLNVEQRSSSPATAAVVFFAMYFATVVWPTSMPSLRSSPWMRGPPCRIDGSVARIRGLSCPHPSGAPLVHLVPTVPPVRALRPR
jgi:hypothetical protein